MSTLKKYYTWAEIKAKVQRDTDTEDEDFIRPEELVEIANEAIDEYEAEINTLTSDSIDYFLTNETLSLVANQDEYDLPTQIYAHKIRKVIYTNGSSVYEIKPARHNGKLLQKAISDQFNTSDLYEYFVKNAISTEPKMVIMPKARETGPNVEIWYLRNLNRMTGDDADICDIPVFINFIFQFIKMRIYEKEGHPNLEFAVQALAQQRAQMQNALSEMHPDGNDHLQMDLSYYEELN